VSSARLFHRHIVNSNLHIEQVLRIYLVADPDHSRGGIVETVADALAGGVTMVQLRAKNLTDREHVALARSMGSLCRDRNVPFIVNDRVDIALAVEADGVHLGVDDLPLPDARRLLGVGAIIGYSPDSDETAQDAEKLGANYLGIGPVFTTATKQDAGEPIGPGGMARRAGLSGLPAIGIGGITARNAAVVIAAGAVGVAVAGAILHDQHPRHAARQLSASVNAAFEVRNG
jgi:thiamine-phosphate pyrophosphorylase